MKEPLFESASVGRFFSAFGTSVIAAWDRENGKRFQGANAANMPTLGAAKVLDLTRACRSRPPASP